MIEEQIEHTAATKAGMTGAQRQLPLRPHHRHILLEMQVGRTHQAGSIGT
jgi:hypothetical protein